VRLPPDACFSTFSVKSESAFQYALAKQT